MGTVREHIVKCLAEAGIEETSRVQVKFSDGTTVTISSDDHPALSRGAQEVDEVKPLRSAQGGR